MPDLDLDGVVTKVRDILAADSRTSSVNWEKGRHTPFGLRTWPAGGVGIGPGLQTGWETAPEGLGGQIVVRVALWTAKHEGLAVAEAARDDLVGKVHSVVWDKANVALAIASYTTKPFISGFAAEGVDSNAEYSPAYAEAILLVTYTLRK